MGQTPQPSRRMVEDRPRDRLSAFLRQKYRGYGAVRDLANDMGSTVRTAENVMLGHWPSEPHLAAIIRRFGKDVWDAVFAPEVDVVLAQLQQEEARLGEQLAEVRRRRRQAEGLGARDPGVRPAAAVDVRRNADD